MIPKIDLHQDIILTYETKPEAFFTDEGKSFCPDYNVGNFSDYQDTFDLVFGAIRPYKCEGNMQDVHNRVIIFNKECIPDLLDAYLSWGDQIPLILNKQDLQKTGCKLLIHLEGHDTLDSTEELKGLFDKGVRSFGLTWNHDTVLAGGNIGNVGLSMKGYEIISAMNERGMLIDTAHMSRQGMKDILAHSTKPILNSHSNVYTLHGHTRNLPDDIIDAFPGNGGVLGVSIYGPFIADNVDVTLDMYLDQIAYLINRIGDDHIGFGTDRHGIPKSKAVKGLDHVSGVHRLEQKMTERFGSITTQKFFYDNAKRVIEHNLI